MGTRAWRAAVIWLLVVIGWGVMTGALAGPAGGTDAAGNLALLGSVFGYAALIVPFAYVIGELSGLFETRED